MKFSKWVLLFAVLAAGRSFAARPLATDDAGTVGPGSFELELGGVYQSAPGTEAWEIPFGIKTGVLPGVDIGLGFGWQRLDEADLTESGITDLELATKWNVLPENNALPGFSLAAAVTIPTADEDRGLGSGKTDWDVTFVFSKTLAECLTGHLNVGYTWAGRSAGEDVGDVVYGSAALELQLCEPCWITGEVLAERERGNAANTELMGNIGMRWIISPNIAFDTAVGTSLSGGDVPDFYATAGLT